MPFLAANSYDNNTITIYDIAAGATVSQRKLSGSATLQCAIDSYVCPVPQDFSFPDLLVESHRILEDDGDDEDDEDNNNYVVVVVDDDKTRCIDRICVSLFSLMRF
jgi:hypothetical protein